MIVFFVAYFLFVAAIVIFYFACMWKIFVKAGEEGWKALIPIYSFIVRQKIIGKPWWWIFLMIIPGVNIVFAVWAANMLSKSFGKDEGFTVGLLLLGFIFYPILAFGGAQYRGPFGDPQAFGNHRNGLQSFDFDR